MFKTIERACQIDIHSSTLRMIPLRSALLPLPNAIAATPADDILLLRAIYNPAFTT